ncbi:MAG: calcium/proton exchanger Cax [Frankiales bacterium]|nr:calcium/proton exchanger Cax [Frankiales bacterium]
MGVINRRDGILMGLGVAFTIGAAATKGVGGLTAFIAAALALAVLATLVSSAVEAMGNSVGPAMIGILQSALGNLPELLILIFALDKGLTGVVQATLVGSILANVALILGAAFVVGGLKNGVQTFPGGAARDIGLTLMLAVFALAVPSLTSSLHTPAAGHERALSVIVAIVLLVAFALLLVYTLTQERANRATSPPVEHHGGWPLWMALSVLAVTGVLAALVSDWFVVALEPSIKTLGISDAFAGLVIVAIAGNAVENVVGVQLFYKNRSEAALQVVLQSPLQIAMVVAPVVLLLSPALGAGGFTLVLPPLLLASLLISALVAVLVVFDGESTWYEGVVLLGLYVLLAASFWWG